MAQRQPLSISSSIVKLFHRDRLFSDSSDPVSVADDPGVGGCWAESAGGLWPDGLGVGRA